MEYLLHIAVLMGIYSCFAVSLDLVAGHGGLLSTAQAAFSGLGAYTVALTATRWGIPFFAGVLAAGGIAAIISFIVSLPTLRLRNADFVIATFGFQMILFGIFNNWVGLTRGPLGIPGIPLPVIFGWRVSSHMEFLILVLVVGAVSHFVVWRLASSPFGRVLHAIREDDLLARALGKNTLYFKVGAFAVSAALAATAGSLYAQYLTYIDPTSFTVMESILVISMVVIGGAGSTWGPTVGAVVLVALPEALRFVGLPSVVAANLRQIIYGSLLVIMMIFRPKGLVGKYGFSK